MVAREEVDIQGLTRANRATARLPREQEAMARPGVATGALDGYAWEVMARLGAEPVFHTEAGFPAAINASVNDAVLYGVPSPYVLQAGDVLSIDVGMRLEGYRGDRALPLTDGGAGETASRRVGNSVVKRGRVTNN